MAKLAAGWMRWGLLLTGQIAVGLAIAGAFLPLLPTTPFLLLAAWCFLRSSPDAHRRLINHPLLGRFLRDWQQHRAIRRSVKWTAVLTVVGLAGLACCVTSSWPVRLATLAGSGIGLCIIVRLPVIRREAAAAEPAPAPNEAV